jgi:hypothetical protein
MTNFLPAPFFEGAASSICIHEKKSGTGMQEQVIRFLLLLELIAGTGSTG